MNLVRASGEKASELSVRTTRTLFWQSLSGKFRHSDGSHTLSLFIAFAAALIDRMSPLIYLADGHGESIDKGWASLAVSSSNSLGTQITIAARCVLLITETFLNGIKGRFAAILPNAAHFTAISCPIVHQFA